MLYIQRQISELLSKPPSYGEESTSRLSAYMFSTRTSSLRVHICRVVRRSSTHGERMAGGFAVGFSESQSAPQEPRRAEYRTRPCMPSSCTECLEPATKFKTRNLNRLSQDRDGTSPFIGSTRSSKMFPGAKKQKGYSIYGICMLTVTREYAMPILF
jgi:hypothetical protein